MRSSSLRPTRPSPAGYLVVCACLAFPLWSQNTHAQNCAQDSIADLAWLLGRELTAADEDALEQALGGPSPSMLDMQGAAQSLGIPLVGVAAELSELGQWRGPKIVHLSHPGHFVVLAQVDSNVAQTVSGHAVQVVATPALAARYSEHALVLADSYPHSGPALDVEVFHHSLGSAQLGVPVAHIFSVRNVGTQDLVVQGEGKG